MNTWEETLKLFHSAWIDSLTETWAPRLVSLGMPQARAPKTELLSGVKLQGLALDLTVSNGPGGIELWASPSVNLKVVAEKMRTTAAAESEKRKLSPLVRIGKLHPPVLPDVSIVFTRPIQAQIWYPASPSDSSLDDSGVWLGYFQFGK
jgi:hypothetical protein